MVLAQAPSQAATQPSEMEISQGSSERGHAHKVTHMANDKILSLPEGWTEDLTFSMVVGQNPPSVSPKTIHNMEAGFQQESKQKSKKSKMDT